MFILVRDRRTGAHRIHYAPHERTVVLDDGTIVYREGNVVIAQTDRDKFTIEAPGSLNFVDREIKFIPFNAVIGGSDNAIELLEEIERTAFREEMPEDQRKLLRLYGALIGLEIARTVPSSLQETVLLTTSRLSGIPLQKLVSETDEIREKLAKELEEMLHKQPELAEAILSAR